MYTSIVIVIIIFSWLGFCSLVYFFVYIETFMYFVSFVFIMEENIVYFYFLL